MTTCAILALNTGCGVRAEVEELVRMELPPLKVLIHCNNGARTPSYMVEDASEALAVAYDYGQESVIILVDNKAIVVDVLTGNVLKKGTWCDNGDVEPNTQEWLQSDENYYYIKE